MGLQQLLRFADIPAQGNPAGLVQLLQLTPPGDRGLVFGRSSQKGVQLGKIPGYWTCPYNATITGVILTADRGGYSVRFWRNLSGRAPLVVDSININGYPLYSPKTHVEHYDLADFIDVEVRAGDTFAVEIISVDDTGLPPTDIAGSLLMIKVDEGVPEEPINPNPPIH